MVTFLLKFDKRTHKIKGYYFSFFLMGKQHLSMTERSENHHSGAGCYFIKRSFKSIFQSFYFSFVSFMLNVRTRSL